jgi:2-oxoglutarate ferredoxin oxidoreductase subunit alpha
MKSEDFVVRFAGEGGQGVVTASDMLARAAASAGYHVLTFATFPSQIMGGPTWTQTRVSSSEILSPGDEVDVLVALSPEAYEAHRDEVRDGGVVIFDSKFQEPAAGRVLGIPLDELAKQAGETRAANMVLMGALCYMVNMSQTYFEEFIFRRYKGRDRIIEANITALRLGLQFVTNSETRLGDLDDPIKPGYQQVLVKGNDALAMGAMAAGLDFYAGYPISPATPILTFMERNLVADGKFAYQVSSEIEAITSLLGASFSGKKAMTATAGPGFSLMGEGLGLAWMAEIPAVVVDVQRGGPATGLPTKTEQSDLMCAMYPAHGDVRLPVIAPGTVQECFYAAIAAINWAERYQGPVVVLSEHSLAERSQNIPTPNLSQIDIENRQVYSGANGYRRYESNELSPFPVPGHPGAYVANGSEHDPIGDTTHLPLRHVQMTERRFGKLQLLENGSYERENVDAPIIVMPWGASKGPAREAYNTLMSLGTGLGWYYTMYLSPLPNKMLEELRQKDLVLVPELNYQGQFASILRSQGVRAEAITQYTGLPFKARDLVKRITAMIKSTGQSEAEE